MLTTLTIFGFGPFHGPFLGLEWFWPIRGSETTFLKSSPMMSCFFPDVAPGLGRKRALRLFDSDDDLESTESEGKRLAGGHRRAL